MGCTQSNGRNNQPTSPHHTVTSESGFQATKSNPLSEKEIQQRIDAPSEVQTTSIAGINFRYAWVSQRGYYPECNRNSLGQTIKAYFNFFQRLTRTIKTLI
jgi:hypothetical protein